jgi:flagellar assembly factor FliW
MNVETTRFGTLTVTPDARIYFPEGLLGFGAYREYVTVPVGPAPGPLMWLQSCQMPELAFVICRAEAIVRDYGAAVLNARARADDLAAIELAGVDEAAVYLVVHRDRGGLVANLRGPLVVNRERRLGKQLVINDERVPLRYTLPLGPAFAAGGEETEAAPLRRAV